MLVPVLGQMAYADGKAPGLQDPSSRMMDSPTCFPRAGPNVPVGAKPPGRSPWTPGKVDTIASRGQARPGAWKFDRASGGPVGVSDRSPGPGDWG